MLINFDTKIPIVDPKMALAKLRESDGFIISLKMAINEMSFCAKLELQQTPNIA